MSNVEKLNVIDGMGFWNRTQQNEKVRSYLGDVSVLNVLSYIPGVQSVVGAFRIWDAVDALFGTDRLENVDRKDVKKFAWVQIARGLSELTGIFGYIFAIADIWSTISRAFKSNQQAKSSQLEQTQWVNPAHAFVNTNDDRARIEAAFRGNQVNQGPFPPMYSRDYQQQQYFSTVVDQRGNVYYQPVYLQAANQ